MAQAGGVEQYRLSVRPLRKGLLHVLQCTMLAAIVAEPILSAFGLQLT